MLNVQRYPMWVYPKEGDAYIVNSEDEEKAFKDVEAKVSGTDEEQGEDEDRKERFELLQKAADLNISIDRRWGVARIQEAINAADRSRTAQ